MLQPNPPPHLARPLLNARNVTELAERRITSFVGGHASRYIALRLQVDVCLHFRGHFRIKPVSPEQVPKMAEKFHDPIPRAAPAPVRSWPRGGRVNRRRRDRPAAARSRRPRATTRPTALVRRAEWPGI